MNRISFYFLFLLLSCHSENKQEESLSVKKRKTEKEFKESYIHQKVIEFIAQNPDNGKPSISKGTYSNGSLENGKLIPFSGKNFEYFSEASYLAKRAFLNDKVLKTLLDTYEELDSIYPGKKFYMMETSHTEGGKFFPHRTHQNGLSVDLMTPLLKDGKEFIGFDSIGIPHYWLVFDEYGKYEKDKSICIHFNLVAHHILLLDKHARKNGMRIYRVHFQNNLHDEFYATEFGKEVRKKGIVLTTGLSKTISEQHDDHFHVDFIEI